MYINTKNLQLSPEVPVFNNLVVQIDFIITQLVYRDFFELSLVPINWNYIIM